MNEAEIVNQLKALLELGKRYDTVQSEIKIAKNKIVDLIVTKGNKKYIIEIKKRDTILYMDVAQLIQYYLISKADGAYLAVPQDARFTENAKRLLKKYGFGLIRFNEKREEEILKTEPNLKEVDAFKSITKEPEKIESKVVEADINIKVEQRKNEFLEELFIYIILGGLLVSTLWYYIEYLFAGFWKNHPLWTNTVFFILSGISLLLYYFLIVKSRHKKE